MLDVYALNIFLTAAEVENFSEAARRLNLTQPAVSMQIQTLERKLDLSLFHRAGRTLNLTEQGRALMPMARDIVNRAARIEEQIESLKGNLSGLLKIAYSTDTARYILLNLIAEFRHIHPQVQLGFYHQDAEQVLDHLEDGLAQLAIVSGQPRRRQVMGYHLLTDPLLLIVPCHHPWARREFVTPDELTEAEFIFSSRGSELWQDVTAGLSQVGLRINDLEVTLEINEPEMIGLAVEDGLGVGFVTRSMVRRCLDLGRFRAVPLDGLTLQREIFLIQSERYPATCAQKEFWRYVQGAHNGSMRPVL